MRISDWSSDLCASDLTVAIVGKYVEHKDAYKSLGEALRHGGIKQRTRVNLDWIDSEQVEAEGAAKVLGKVDAILVPGGFGKRGFEGKILSTPSSRERADERRVGKECVSPCRTRL